MASTDTERLDWIERFIRGASLSATKDDKGTVHMVAYPVDGKPLTVDARTFRAALDKLSEKA